MSAVLYPATIDDPLVRAFEDCTLEPARFRHREHVYVAYCYLRALPFEDAAPRFVRNLRRFAAAHGARDKFHATVTWAWLAIIAEAAALQPAGEGFDALLAAHPALLAHDVPAALAAYY